MQIAPISPNSAVSGNYWQWQGHNIYYVRAGVKQPQRPPLLLIHGFGASTDHWDKNIAQLQETFEVWAIDLLGFGRSAKPNLQYSGNLWRDQLNDFITEIIGQPVILAGNSLGGYASLCVAAECPNAAKGLILLNSAGPFSDSKNPKKPNPIQKLIRSVLLHPFPSYLLFQYMRRPANIRKTLKKVYLNQEAVTDKLVEDIYRPSCDEGAVQVFASVFKTPQGETVDNLLQQLTHPLLMLWGSGDPWMNAKQRGEKYRQYYPNLTEYYLEAGHCPHDEIPDEVNRLIHDWVMSH
ncbi:alpha/beta fold hydrolase [Crocosphaera sp. UHCC 0190]|uniref:alpha/beta fold hydrolase n=1 Tax=Crocosphaera sp. UHCC 0190 TaxID=3110246 RepID=UPI002B1FDC0A|nr:alpha/beta fold hydrolase [Crocosphaera sp. UHCC 0190]MEA5510067.1 alpha/beta fold hydrolase [Crocosphaera sp. UHCC 0190]